MADVATLGRGLAFGGDAASCFTPTTGGLNLEGVISGLVCAPNEDKKRLLAGEEGAGQRKLVKRS